MFKAEIRIFSWWFIIAGGSYRRNLFSCLYKHKETFHIKIIKLTRFMHLKQISQIKLVLYQFFLKSTFLN